MSCLISRLSLVRLTHGVVKVKIHALLHPPVLFYYMQIHEKAQDYLYGSDVALTRASDV